MVLYLIRKLKMITIVSKNMFNKVIDWYFETRSNIRNISIFDIFFNTLKKNCSYKSLKNYILDKWFSFTYPVTPHHTISNIFAWRKAPEKCIFGKRFTLELVHTMQWTFSLKLPRGCPYITSPIYYWPLPPTSPCHPFYEIGLWSNVTFW